MRIRLVQKLAETIDGVDISDYAVGDVIDLHVDEARLLVAERWAIPLDLDGRTDAPRRTPLDQLRRASRRIEQQGFKLPYGRRREDVFVDELHDARARTIHCVGA
jgi:hypothetical protein